MGLQTGVRQRNIGGRAYGVRPHNESKN